MGKTEETDATDATDAKRTLSAWAKRQNAGLWFGIGFLLFALLFFRMSFNLSYMSKLGAGPGMYPRWLSGVAVVVALVYIWQSVKGQQFLVGECFPSRKELINVGSVFLSCLVFLLLLNHVGFIVAGSLLMFIMFVRHYLLWQAVALSIGISSVCYVLFKVCFSVPLP